MAQFDKELKMYAESGLRTAADWLTIGRELQPAQKPRSDTISRGQVVDLFSRDQTRPAVSHRQ